MTLFTSATSGTGSADGLLRFRRFLILAIGAGSGSFFVRRFSVGMSRRLAGSLCHLQTIITVQTVITMIDNEVGTRVTSQLGPGELRPLFFNQKIWKKKVENKAAFLESMTTFLSRSANGLKR
jgi:hypothetical protein